MKKFITVKLNGWNEKTASEPIIKGVIYRIAIRLLKYFSSIN